MREQLRYWFLFSLVVVVVGGLVVGVGGVTGDKSGIVTEADEEISIDTERVNIDLQAQRTNIEAGESVQLSHSVANLHLEEEVTVQLVLEAPSGADVSGTADVDGGSASQFITTVQLGPGEVEDQRITIDLLEPGEYELTGQAIYYFGDNPGTGDGEEISIPIEKHPPPPSTTEQITDFTTDVITFVPETQNTIATDLEQRALAGEDQTMIGIYAAGVVAISLVLVLVLSPVIKLLTGRSIARDMRRYPAAMSIGESNVGVFLMLVGFGLFILDTTALADGAPVGSVLSAQVLAGLLVLAPFVVVLSVIILMKARIVSALLTVKLGLIDSFRER